MITFIHFYLSRFITSFRNFIIEKLDVKLKIIILHNISRYKIIFVVIQSFNATLQGVVYLEILWCVEIISDKSTNSILVKLVLMTKQSKIRTYNLEKRQKATSLHCDVETIPFVEAAKREKPRKWKLSPQCLNNCHKDFAKLFMSSLKSFMSLWAYLRGIYQRD